MRMCPLCPPGGSVVTPLLCGPWFETGHGLPWNAPDRLQICCGWAFLESHILIIFITPCLIVGKWQPWPKDAGFTTNNPGLKPWSFRSSNRESENWELGLTLTTVKLAIHNTFKILTKQVNNKAVIKLIFSDNIVQPIVYLLGLGD